MKSKFVNANLQNKSITRLLFVTLGILLIPFFGNIFVDGWNWDTSDFVIMGALIFGTGLVVELANKRIKNKNHRIIVICLIVLILLVTWIHLAVGIVDIWPFAGS